MKLAIVIVMCIFYASIYTIIRIIIRRLQRKNRLYLIYEQLDMSKKLISLFNKFLKINDGENNEC